MAILYPAQSASAQSLDWEVTLSGANGSFTLTEFKGLRSPGANTLPARTDSARLFVHCLGTANCVAVRAKVTQSSLPAATAVDTIRPVSPATKALAGEVLMPNGMA